MGLVHADAFSFYSTAQTDRVYPDLLEFSGVISIGAFGRNGIGGVQFTSFEDHVSRLNLTNTSGSVFITQFDVRISAAPAAANAIGSCSDGATEQCSLVMNADRTLSVYRGTVAGTLLGSPSSYVVPLDTDIHIGVKITIHGSTGSVVVHVWEDGDTAAQVVLNLSNQNTKNTANVTWNGFGIGGVTSTGLTEFCNLVVMDGSGSSANDLLGPVDVRALFASARLTPSLTDWSLSSGSSAAALLEELTADDDATYLSETTQNQQMTVAVDALPSSRAVLGAQLYAAVRLASGSPTLKAIGYQSGTPNLGANFSPTAAYTYLMQPYSALPDGTAFSTAAVFDALQWGLKLTTNTTGARVSQIVVAVIQTRGSGARNLATGYGHTVTGSDNVASGSGNTVLGSKSQAHGSRGTVTGERSVLYNLDGVTREVSGDGKFEVWGELGGNLVDEVSTSKAGLAPIITGSDGYVLTKSGAGSVWSPSGAGGGVATFEFIEEQTPSGVSTITFSSLGSYTHLKIIWRARSTDNSAISTSLQMRFNADSGANYDRERVQGSAATATAQEDIAQTSTNVGTATANLGSGANQSSTGEITIHDYRDTTFEKNWLADCMAKRANSTNNILRQSFGGSWRDVSAIASITLFLAAGNYVAGSKFTLYGMT